MAKRQAVRSEHTINGQPITWVKNPRRRKSMALYVLSPEHIEVRTPWRSSFKQVEHFIYQQAEWIEKRRMRLLENPAQKVSSRNRAEAFKIIENRLSYCLPIIHEKGIKHDGSFNIRSMKRSWGRCRSDGSITFNVKLASLPTHLIDYVIFHEFCHVSVMNHGKRFHSLLESLYPNHRAYEKELHGYTLD